MPMENKMINSAGGIYSAYWKDSNSWNAYFKYPHQQSGGTLDFAKSSIMMFFKGIPLRKSSTL